MYTIVLAAFLTTGNEVPDFGRRGGCHGCRGGCYGCYGGGWGGCYGCYGGGWGGCFGCGGGWGGCYGCYGGGWGGCFGCGGGCFGCGGGMAAMSAGGFPGSQGGGGGGSGAQGGGGGAGSQGGGGGSAEVTRSLRELKMSLEALKKNQTQIRIDALKIVAEELKRRETDQRIDELRRDVNDMRRRMPPPPGGVPPPPKNRRELPPPKEGKVLLEMPADAVVIINERRIDAATSYLTQPLDADKEYVLTVEAAVVRDGKSINRVKRALIHRGEVVRLAYNDMESTDGRWDAAGDATGSPAHITVRLPADARLTVHGVACPLTSETRVFDTPTLPAGQKFYYLLKAEIVRNGRSIAQTRRVDFRSGERVTVSFEELGANRVAAR